MARSRPKDYQLAEAAYKTYWEDPQVPFDALSHDYIMNWVRVARIVVALHNNFKLGPRSPESIAKQRATRLSNKVDKMLNASKRKPPPDGFKGSEEQRRIWREISQRKRDAKRAKAANGAGAS